MIKGVSNSGKLKVQSDNITDEYDLKTIQFNKEMTTVHSKEWTTKDQMLPTLTASDGEGGVAKDVQHKNGSFFRENQKGERWGVKLSDAVSILPTPRANQAMAANLDLPSIKNHLTYI